MSPGHFCRIRHTRDAREDNGADSVISDVIVRHEAHIGNRVDDGRGQAEEYSIAGTGDGEILPGQGQASLESSQLHRQDDQCHGEAETPREKAPASHGAHPGTHIDH